IVRDGVLQELGAIQRHRFLATGALLQGFCAQHPWCDLKKRLTPWATHGRHSYLAGLPPPC
ncbi:MAG: hypothetical protein ACRCZF_15260, partial [Gemmataceae bacterium]